MTTGLIALAITFVLGFFIYPIFIEQLKKSTAQQQVSEYALDEFKDKQKTVTFGGLVFVVLPVVVTFFVSLKSMNINLLLIMGMYLAYGLLGLIDDYKIIKEGKNDGLSAKTKLLTQFLLGVVFYFVFTLNGGSTALNIPIVNYQIELGILYLPFVVFMLAAYSNAVNLTDGMDGLATGTSIIAFIPLIIFAFKEVDPSLFIFLLSVVGALLAFLVYNYNPAKIFMGDVGSLALGSLFALATIYLKLEILSIVIGGVFVYETLCVVIQQVAVRVFKKRVFRYTPIHYSFTLSGWKEITVVHFFWGLGLVFAILASWIGTF